MSVPLLRIVQIFLLYNFVVPSLSFLLPTSFSSAVPSVVASTARTSNHSNLRWNIKMSSPITEIKTSNAPAPVGPYSQAVLAGSTLYVSGNIALDPKTGGIVGGGDVQAEARQVLKNMDAVLKEAGASPKNVVRCTVFLADLKDFAVVNEVYSDYFKECTVAPSRSCVQVAALPKGVLVEIDCIAVL
jgi:2-iminobutanoate/2-iminopropanoate deaminase